MNTHRKTFAAFLTGFTSTALVLLLAVDPAAHAAMPAMQLVRPGDSSMTCESLASEINMLAQPTGPDAAADTPHAKKHGGLTLLRAFGSAAPMLGGFGGSGGAIVSSVAGVATSAAAQEQGQAAMDDARTYARAAMAGPSIRDQRKARLTSLFEQKGC